MSSLTVTLNNGEQVAVRILAQLRYFSARAGGVTDAKMGDQSTDETDLEGLGAEIAFCKLFNYCPDLSFGPRSGGCDVINRDGKKIDVKTTKYETGRLLATLKKENEDIDIYALMIGSFPTYRFAGYARKNDLFKQENIDDLGHGKGYALAQDKLRMPKNFREMAPV